MGGSQVLVASSGLRLNNKGDSLTLVNANGERVDGMEYKASLADGASMVRAVDGDGGRSVFTGAADGRKRPRLDLSHIGPHS